MPTSSELSSSYSPPPETQAFPGVSDEDAATLTEAMTSWGFDVLSFRYTAPEKLPIMVYLMYQNLKLIDEYELNSQTLWNFILAVQSK